MDIYSFFNRKEKSKDIAKDRLKLVLVHDRVNCSSNLLEMLKNDIIKVISIYMEIDEESLDIQITQGGGGADSSQAPTLYANIPIKSMKKVSK